MRVILVFLLLVFSGLAFSQKARIVGRVTDDNNKPLFGATVIFKQDVTVGAYSDENGNYVLEIPPGDAILIFRYSGMATDTVSVSVKDGEIKQMDFQMFSLVTVLEGVEVRVGKFDRPIEEQTVSLEIIRAEYIENKNTRSIETALDQTPGLNIMDGEPQIRGGSGFTFGVGSKVAVIVDDMPLLSGDAGRPEWGFVPVENIHQIEVIKGASSVLSGSSALSGSIHIRTKYPSNEPLTKVNVYTGMYSYPRDTGQIWQDNRPSLISGANFLHSRKLGNWDLTFGGNLNYDEGYMGAPILDPYIAQSFPDTVSNFTNEQMRSKRARINFNIRHRSKKMRGLSYGVNGNAMLSESPMVFAWLNDTTGLYRGYPGATFLQKQTIFNIDPYLDLNMASGSKHKLRARFLYTDNDITANQSNQSELYLSIINFNVPTLS